MVEKTSPVPEPHRAALRLELYALADGLRPQPMTWVHAYGSSGAKFIHQLDEIWNHAYLDCQERTDSCMWVTMRVAALEAEFVDRVN